MCWRRKRVLGAAAAAAALWLCVFGGAGTPLLSTGGEAEAPPKETTAAYRQHYVDSDIPPGCECKDAETGLSHSFCYQPIFNRSLIGRPFPCAHLPILKRLGLLASDGFIELDKEPLPEPTFVTGSSDSHFAEQVRLVDTIQRFLPSAKIVVYDLGLNAQNVARLRSLCQVAEVRKFDFSAYPPQVKALSQYRWKPIIIAAAVAEFGAIWWMDSSVVFKKADLRHVYALVECRNKTAIPDLLRRAPEAQRGQPPQRRDVLWIEDGWHVADWEASVRDCHKFTYLLQGFTGHGIFPATHPGVYAFLPTSPAGIQRETAKMYEAGFLFTLRAPDAVRDVLRWYVLCALEPDCMAPPGAGLGCHWSGKDRFRNYAGCHRFDQSVVNLLLANRNGFDRRHYTSTIVDFFNIKRGAGPTQPRECPKAHDMATRLSHIP